MYTLQALGVFTGRRRRRHRELSLLTEPESRVLASASEVGEPLELEQRAALAGAVAGQEILRRRVVDAEDLEGHPPVAGAVARTSSHRRRPRCRRRSGR